MADSARPLYTHRLEWTGPAHSSVICTGDFDDWKGSQQLEKDPQSGKWSAELKVPYASSDVKYKFVVDGTWQHAHDQQVVQDSAGNANNVFTVPAGPPQDVAAEPVAEKAADDEDAETSSVVVKTDSPKDAETEATALNDEVEQINTASSEQDGERDLPRTLQDLFSGTGSDAFGNGGNPLGLNNPGFYTYNMQSFAIVKALEPFKINYPSAYLMQRLDGTSEFSPTDVQIACEYIFIKFRIVHAQAQERIKLQQEIEQARKDQQRAEEEAQSDRKLLEAEEASGETAKEAPEEGEISTDLDELKTSSDRAKLLETKKLPPIQVPGIAKFYAGIKEAHPKWVFSEKRFRKIITTEEAMEEATRIIRLAGLMGTGKYAQEQIPFSKWDPKLAEELDAQWAERTGVSAATCESSSTQPAQESSPTQSETATMDAKPTLDNDTTENKENELPSASTSNGTSAKNKKKKNKSSTSAVAALAGDILEGVEAVANKVASALPSGNSSSAQNGAASAATTTSTLNRNVTNLTGDIAVKWISPSKGRGLFARRKLPRGSVIFKEDAFVFAPIKSIQQHVNESKACAFCGKLLTSRMTALIVPCTAHERLPTTSTAVAGGPRSMSVPRKVSASKSSSGATSKKSETKSAEEAADSEKAKAEKEGCNLKYCSKTCREHNNEFYANLLCPIVNPSIRKLLQWVESIDPRIQKQNALGVFLIYLRLIVAAARPGPDSAAQAVELLNRIECLTAITERIRRNRDYTVLAEMQHGNDWMTGFRLVYEALQLPDKYYKPFSREQQSSDEQGTGSLATQVNGIGEEDKSAEASTDGEGNTPTHPYPGATLKRSEHGGILALPEWYRKFELPEELLEKVFGFDNYLLWLGRVALNQEDDGGLYLAHACLNHACDPNATVRRTPAMNNIGAREARPARIFVLAEKDIEEGEEITVLYPPAGVPLGARRATVKHDYLFDCQCKFCERVLQGGGDAEGIRTGRPAIMSNGQGVNGHAGHQHPHSDTTASADEAEEPEEDVIALALQAPPGATVGEGYSKIAARAAHLNGSAEHEDEASEPVRLSAATRKKKNKKAALRLKQQQAEEEAAAREHALDPYGIFKNNTKSVPWYEEDVDDLL